MFNLNGETNYFLSVFSERDIIDLNWIKLLIKKVQEVDGILWISIVDQEGDITYYGIKEININGKNRELKYKKIKAILTEDRVLIFNKNLSYQLFKNEFYGKPFGNGLQLSMVEALYLLKKGILKIQNIGSNNIISFNLLKKIVMKKQPDIDALFTVFSDLKNRGLIVKTGFKFGSHFRSYTSSPDNLHAEYLIHIFYDDLNIYWSDFSRAVRLGHSVNKEIVFACLIHKKINYIKIERLRP